MEIGQFASTFHPGFNVAPATQGELFFDRLRDKLAQWNTQRTGGGLGLAKGRVGDLQRGLHEPQYPIFMGQPPVWIRQSASDNRICEKPGSPVWTRSELLPPSWPCDRTPGRVLLLD